MRWIHLSDLHIDPPSDGRSTEQLREELLAYIQREQITADYLFITGDYRNAKYSREDVKSLVKAAADFIISIASAAKIEITNIYLVPGNHDVNRTNEKKRVKYVKKVYDFADGVFQPEDLDFLLGRFTFFISLCHELKNRGVRSIWSDNLQPLHPYVCYEDFNLLCLNTCIICNSNKDRHDLIIGNRDLYHSLQEIQRKNPDKPIVILAHHGLAYLHDDERMEVVNLFSKYPVKLYLCGDTHKPWVRRENQILEITMGCSVNERGSIAVFSAGEMKDGEISVEAYEWKEECSRWEPFTGFNKCFESRKTKVITKMYPVSPDFNFTGRENELEQLKRAIADNEKIILLHGMSGIGKTELCRQIFRQCLTPASPIQKIGWISYQNTIEDSFWKQFPEIVDKKEKPNVSSNVCGPEDGECNDINAYWVKVKNYLNRQEQTSLLIIDNANEIKDSEILLLTQLNCQVILTSWRQIDGVRCMDITRLPEDDCQKLYRIYSHDDIASDIVIENIIGLTCGHTLLIQLLAKLQYAAGLAAEQFYQLLKNEGFDLSGITENISYLHNPEINQGETRDKQIIEHIEKLFHIKEIAPNSEEMQILQFFFLFSPGCVIPMQTAKKWMNLENLNTVNALVDKGWLDRRCQNGIPVVTIHPMTFIAIRHVGNPTDELETMWIKNIFDDVLLETDEVAADKIDILPLAEAMVKNAHIRNIEYIKLWGGVLAVYIANGEYRKALEDCKKLLETEETVIGKQHIYMAKTYNTFGAIYDGLIQYTAALDWFKKGSEMCEKILGSAHLDTAVSFCNVASTYLKLNMPEDAQTWVKRAYAIVKSQPDNEYTAEAGSVYMTKGNICCRATGRVGEAISCFEKALEIHKMVSGEEHPTTMAIYGNIAVIYHACGETKKALTIYHKVREIYERKLGEKHPNTTYIYRNIGNVYRTEKKYEEALKWYSKTVRIREEIYGVEHLHTAHVYNDIGMVYYEQGKWLKALKEYKKALPIYINAVGENDNETQVIYHNIEEVHKSFLAVGILVIVFVRILYG